MSTINSRGAALVGLILVLLLIAAAALAQAPASPPADGVYRFDFGPPESPVGAGFHSVQPDTGYTADRKFGYVAGGEPSTVFDQNRRIIRDVLVLDDVTRDGIYDGPAFRVDVPNGTYRVVVLTGQYSRPGANRPDSHFRDATITAGDATLFEQVNTPEAFYDPAGRYFANYYRDWHPDVNLYQANIARWIPYGEAEVAVTDGHVLVRASRYAPVNALWIFAADNEAGPAALGDFRARQEAHLNDQYPYLPGEPDLPMPELEGETPAALVYPYPSAGALRPETRPAPSDLDRPLRLFASLGEREAGVVAVTPLRDIGGRVELTASDLQGDDGASIPASAFDIRYVRYGEYPVPGGYAVRPHFLVPWAPEGVEEGVTRGFWVDLRVPDDASPGFYAGALTLRGLGVEAALRVEVRILPLKLPMSRLYAGVYAGDLEGTVFRHLRMFGDPPRELISQVLRTRMEFYADQGFTGVFDSLPWYPFELQDGAVTRTEAWERYLEVFRTAKSIPNFRERIFCYYMGGPQIFPKCPGYVSVQAAEKMEIDEIAFTDEAVEQMSAMVRLMYEEMRAEDLPELVFYVFDELGNHGAKGARWGREMLKAINRCREAVPGGFRTCVSTLRASVAREYLAEADIVLPNSAYPLTAETIQEIRDAGGTLGLYNLGANRFSFGFYPWRVDAYCRAQWSFSYDGDARDPYVALPAGSRVSCDCRYTPEWEVLPSIGMLEQREGVDDYRYIQLLEELIATAEDQGRGGEARAARAVLDDLRDSISETYLDPANDWDRSTMDYHRWQVARAALDLAEQMR